MAVVKTASPNAIPREPTDRPSKTVPSSRTRNPLIELPPLHPRPVGRDPTRTPSCPRRLSGRLCSAPSRREATSCATSSGSPAPARAKCVEVEQDEVCGRAAGNTRLTEAVDPGRSRRSFARAESAARARRARPDACRGPRTRSRGRSRRTAPPRTALPSREPRAARDRSRSRRSSRREAPSTSAARSVSARTGGFIFTFESSVRTDSSVRHRWWGVTSPVALTPAACARRSSSTDSRAERCRR